MTDLRAHAPATEWPASNQIRDQLQATLTGTYTLERELGGGGMSRVFVAEEIRLKRKVAVKVLSPELAQGLSVERFEREIQTAAALQQANIVPLLSAGDTNGLPFYTMPFVEGESLRARLMRGPLGVSEAIGVLRDVSKALAYAHARGVVHRDIKPDNVLISGGTAVVTDFGIAKAISASRTASGGATLTQVGTSIGTPAYMAPEQAAGDPDIDHRADIYSLGAMAYELLSGQAVFAGRTPQRMLVAHMSEMPKSIGDVRADIPKPLAELVMSCLAKDAKDRPQQAADIARVLDSITSGSGLQAMPHVLLGGAHMFRRAIAFYVAAFVFVAVIAKAATVGIGLPDWVFPGSMVVMSLGLPVLLWTAYVQRVAHRAITLTPTFTPGGSPLVQRGTMATMALQAAPKMTWSRTARGGMLAMGAFVVVIAVFMTMRAFGVGPFGSLIASGALNARDKVLVADFTASNGDKALGRVVSDAIRTGLGDSRVMTLMSPAEIGLALQRMQQPTSARVDLNLARQIAFREGVKAIVDGEVTLVGTSYIVSARLLSVDSVRELASYQATASSSNALIEVADGISRKLRAKAGESLRGVQSTPPLAYASTSSLEALRKYSDGVRATDMDRDFRNGVLLLREAVTLDSNFAEAWRKLAVTMRNSRTYPRSAIDTAIRHAFSLKDRMTERERDLVIATYYINTPGYDREKAFAALQRMLARGDSQFAIINIGSIYSSRREYAQAETALRAATRMVANPVLAYNNLQGVLRVLGKTAEYDSLMANLKVRFPGNTAALGSIFLATGERGRFDEAGRMLDSARRAGDPRRIAAVTEALGDLSIELGKFEQHREVYRKLGAIETASGQSPGALTRALVLLTDAINWHAPTEPYVRAVDEALESTKLEQLPESDRPYLHLARLNALTGRVDRAKQFVARYEATAKDTAARRWFLNDLRYAQSAIQLAEGRWKEAAATLHQAYTRPDGYGAPSSVNGSFSWALEMDLFDLFATANQPDSALAAYDTYRKSPRGARKREGPDVWVGAGRYEALARMYDAKGDTANAVTHYREMIELWKNADAEVQPRVAAARARVQQLTPVEKTGKSVNARKSGGGD